jgi:ABC-type uncharacterized transport system substrate-binding protein
VRSFWTSAGRAFAATLPCLLGLATTASAHPHVFADATAEIRFDDEGRIVSVRNSWRFDKAFTAFAIDGIDKDDDGTYSRTELDTLAAENIESLADFDYFTRLTVAGKPVPFRAPAQYRGEISDGRFQLTFDLPLSDPAKPSPDMSLSISDPQYYVTVDFAGEAAIRTENAPAGCRTVFHPPQGADAETVALLSMLAPDQRELPPELKDAASRLGSRITFDCS